MFKIRDWLYISGYPAAASGRMVSEAKIGAMLQLHRPFEVEHVETLYLNLRDGFPIRPVDIDAGIAFIQGHQARGDSVLVTCGAGISRSVTMSVAALARIEGITLAQAFREIRRHHPHAMPDHVHWNSIATHFGQPSDFWEMWSAMMLDDDL